MLSVCLLGIPDKGVAIIFELIIIRAVSITIVHILKVLYYGIVYQTM